MVKVDQLRELYPEQLERCSVETPPGWDEQMAAMVMTMVSACPTIMFTQIKEKFGGLRVYYSVNSLKDYDVAEELEEHFVRACSATCQVCGKVDNEDVQTTTRQGWVSTECSEHRRT